MSTPLEEYNALLQALPVQLKEFFKQHGIIPLDVQAKKELEQQEIENKVILENIITTVNLRIENDRVFSIERFKAALNEQPLFKTDEPKRPTHAEMKLQIEAAAKQAAEPPKPVQETKEKVIWPSVLSTSAGTTKSELQKLRYLIAKATTTFERLNRLLEYGNRVVEQINAIRELQAQEQNLSPDQKTLLKNLQAELQEAPLLRRDLNLLIKQRDHLLEEATKRPLTEEEQKQLDKINDLIPKLQEIIPISVLPAAIDAGQARLDELRLQSRQDVEGKGGLARVNELFQLGQAFVLQEEALEALKEELERHPIDDPVKAAQVDAQVIEMENLHKMAQLDKNEIQHWLVDHASYLQGLDVRDNDQQKMLNDLNVLILKLGVEPPKPTENIPKPQEALSRNEQSIKEHFKMSDSQAREAAQVLKEKHGDIPNAVLNEALKVSYPDPYPPGNQYNPAALASGIQTAVTDQVDRAADLKNLSPEGKQLAQDYFAKLEREGAPAKPSAATVAETISNAEQTGNKITVNTMSTAIDRSIDGKAEAARRENAERQKAIANEAAAKAQAKATEASAVNQPTQETNTQRTTTVSNKPKPPGPPPPPSS